MLVSAYVCPDCGSGEQLRSWEPVSVGYLVRVTDAADPGGGFEKGGRHDSYADGPSVVSDDGAAFVDDLWCRCGWNGSVAELVGES